MFGWKSDKAGNHFKAERKKQVQGVKAQPESHGMIKHSFLKRHDKHTKIGSYIDAESLGLKIDGLPLNSIVEGHGADFKIIAYPEGSTFNQETIKHVAQGMKKYEVYTPDDPENDYGGGFYAINDELARKMIKDHFVGDANLKIFRVDTESHEVKL